MIERDKIKWIDNLSDVGGGSLWYKEVKLDLSPEMIQGIATDFISKETAEKAILDAYKRCLRLHREKLLDKLLNNDKN